MNKHITAFNISCIDVLCAWVLLFLCVCVCVGGGGSCLFAILVFRCEVLFLFVCLSVVAVLVYGRES